MFCTSMVSPKTIKNAWAAFASSRERFLISVRERLFTVKWKQKFWLIYFLNVTETY